MHTETSTNRGLMDIVVGGAKEIFLAQGEMMPTWTLIDADGAA